MLIGFNILLCVGDKPTVRACCVTDELRNAYLEKAGVIRKKRTDKTEGDKDGVGDQVRAEESAIRGCSRRKRQKLGLVLLCHSWTLENTSDAE